MEKLTKEQEELVERIKRKLDGPNLRNWFMSEDEREFWRNFAIKREVRLMYGKAMNDFDKI